MKIQYSKNMQVEDLREWLKQERLDALGYYQALRPQGFKTAAEGLDWALAEIEKKLKAWEKEQGV